MGRFTLWTAIMTKQLPNEILVRHSLWDWIRIFDRMRADRYAFLQPIGKYSALEDLLEIDYAASKISLVGDRYPEKYARMISR